MKKNFFRSMGVFVCAFPHFILFELLFKLLLTAIGAPILTLLLRLTMKISQVNYISDEKLWVYLKHPVTLAVVALVVFFSAIFSLMELSALTACFSCYAKGGRITTGGMFRAGISAVGKAFRKRGGIKALMIMPLTEFTLSSGVFMMPILPILQRIFKNINGSLAIVAFIALEIIFITLIINYSYSLHYLILTDRSFKQCAADSKKLISGKRLHTAFSVILWSVCMLIAAALVTFVISFVILLFIKGFSSPQRAFLSALKVLRYAGDIFSAASSFLIAPAIMCCLTRQFFAILPESEAKTLNYEPKPKMKTLPKVIIIVTSFAVSITLNYNYFKSVYKGNINLNVGIITRTRITAHRGASASAPENTIYAFQAAVESGADYIELDVQLTSDGQLVVFHDEKLDRVTDGKGKLKDHTYDELQQLSAGIRFGGEFADAKIPLLSEVFEEIGSDVLYNVEIKDYGDTDQTVIKTVETIEEFGLENSCYITSFSYNVLKKVKAVSPDIKTGLIANASASSFNKLKYIDALSMNHLFVNSSVVNNAHQNGKRIFVWTVDNTNDIQRMSSLGVDNIITNRPKKAAELVYSKSIKKRILAIIKAVFS